MLNLKQKIFFFIYLIISYHSFASDTIIKKLPSNTNVFDNKSGIIFTIPSINKNLSFTNILLYDINVLEGNPNIELTTTKYNNGFILLKSNLVGNYTLKYKQTLIIINTNDIFINNNPLGKTNNVVIDNDGSVHIGASIGYWENPNSYYPSKYNGIK